MRETYSSTDKAERVKFFASLDDLESKIDAEIESEDKVVLEKENFDESLAQWSKISNPRSEKSLTLNLRKISKAKPSLQKEAVDLLTKHPFSYQGALETRFRGRSSEQRQQQSRKVGTGLERIPQDQQIFGNLVFYFLPNDTVSPARRLRIEKAIAYGAIWEQTLRRKVTHMIIDDDFDVHQLSRFLENNKIHTDLHIVRSGWLTECLGYKEVRNANACRFRVNGVENWLWSMKQNQEINERHHIQWEQNICTQEVVESRNIPISSRFDCKDVDNLISALDHGGPHHFFPPKPELAISAGNLYVDGAIGSMAKENRGFLCMEKCDGNKSINPNARTIEILKEMATHYEQIGDHWRTTGYRKCITALRKQTSYVGTLENALALRGVGQSLASKIEEIASTDHLRKLEHLYTDPNSQLLRLFMGIYQVGPKLASKWILQGYRSLEQLQMKVDLSASQRIGIDRYHDFKQRIPRFEVELHAAVIEKALKEADSQLQLIVAGSYRREEVDCGDIDILITKEGSSVNFIRAIVLKSVIPRLTKKGFIKAALTGGHFNTCSSIWHGASLLPGCSIWRRIDLLFVPWSQLGAALIYFTGSDIFNRSLRLLAARKRMRLNQHGLYSHVLRSQGRKRLNQGRLLEAQNEQRIFEILKVPYKPPKYRRC